MSQNAATLTKDESGKLWAELKRMWAIVKDQSKTDADKQNAKDRINQVQKDLSLDVTDFTKPFVPKSKTAETSVASQITESAQIVATKNGVVIQNSQNFLQEFMDVAFPIAHNKAVAIDPQGSQKDINIATFALLKPLGAVYGSLVRNLGK